MYAASQRVPEGRGNQLKSKWMVTPTSEATIKVESMEQAAEDKWEGMYEKVEHEYVLLWDSQRKVFKIEKCYLAMKNVKMIK